MMAGTALKLLSSAARRMKARLLGGSQKSVPDSPFDIRDLRVLNPLLERHGCRPLAADLRACSESPSGAARYLLGVLLGEPGIRKKYPRGLHEGLEGAFAKRIVQRLSSDPTAVENVASVIAGDFSDRVRRIYEFRPDMREVFPLGMTPQQRREYLDWLLTHGRSEMSVTPEQAVWFFVRQDETPDRGLVPTWLLNPKWQKQFPQALTIFGWNEFVAFLKAECGLTSSWADQLPIPPYYRPWDQVALLRRARPELEVTFPAKPTDESILAWLDSSGYSRPESQWSEDLAEDVRSGLPALSGINVFAHFRFPCGLQQSALAVVRGFGQVGIRTSCRDMLPEFPGDLGDLHRFDGIERFPVTVAVAGINTPPIKYLSRSGVDLRPDVYRAAILYWESEEPPADFDERVRPFDEIWAPTRFLAESFRKRATVPVVPMLPGLELPSFVAKERSYFDLPSDRFLFLFTYDMASSQARKNPLALISAFRKAFRNDEPVGLVIKVSRGSEFPEDFAALRAACGDNGVTVIDRLMARDDLLALMKSCDAYASLHRSEGLGLGMAEAMLMGKPVVATAYSGNLDFMTAETAYLVEFERVPVPESSPYPAGSMWAEPSIEHASQLLRRVYDQRCASHEVGLRAKADLEERLSLRAAGERMASRIREIEARLLPELRKQVHHLDRSH